MVIDIVAVPLQPGPAVGVKVYTVVPTDVVLMVAGLQVPLILFVEVVGNDGAVEF